jgi:RNA polymerase sigma-70 factor (ECF subfamily)
MGENEETILRYVSDALEQKPGAFESLIQAYERKAYLHAYRLCGHREDALEITQEIFLKLYRSLSGFRRESSFNTWFYRLATNVAYDFLRKRYRDDKNRSFSWDDDQEDRIEQEPMDPTPWPEEIAEKEELKNLMQQALWELRPDHREVLFLYDFENRSYEEIAELLDCQLGTVKSRLHRARNELRKIILELRELFEGYLRHTNQKGGSSHGL